MKSADLNQLEGVFSARRDIIKEHLKMHWHKFGIITKPNSWSWKLYII